MTSIWHKTILCNCISTDDTFLLLLHPVDHVSDPFRLRGSAQGWTPPVSLHRLRAQPWAPGEEAAGPVHQQGAGLFPRQQRDRQGPGAQYIVRICAAKAVSAATSVSLSISLVCLLNTSCPSHLLQLRLVGGCILHERVPPQPPCGQSLLLLGRPALGILSMLQLLCCCFGGSAVSLFGIWWACREIVSLRYSCLTVSTWIKMKNNVLNHI